MPSNKSISLLNTATCRGISCQLSIKIVARIFRSLILSMLVTFCAWNVCVAEESSDRESQITAAYLFHFTKFTEWPTVAPIFHYCIFENADFAELLKKTYSDKTIGKASIEVKNIDAQAKLDECQLIYFSQTAHADFLAKISKNAILSVGTQKDFIKLGGIIYLFEEDQKIRFYINSSAAADVGLKISSQLLQLSKEP